MYVQRSTDAFRMQNSVPDSCETVLAMLLNVGIAHKKSQAKMNVFVHNQTLTRKNSETKKKKNECKQT